MTVVLSFAKTPASDTLAVLAKAKAGGGGACPFAPKDFFTEQLSCRSELCAARKERCLALMESPLPTIGRGPPFTTLDGTPHTSHILCRSLTP